METGFAPQKTQKKTKTVKSNKPPKEELPGMPSNDPEPGDSPLIVAAKIYNKASDEARKAKERLSDAAMDVLSEMRKARRFIIPVAGGTLEAKEVAAKTEIKFIRAKGN